MPTIIARYGLAYFGVPKVASSSMKRVIFTLEHGETYLDDGWQEAGQPGPLHQLYPTDFLRRGDFKRSQNCFKFAVVRDPVDRILSAYGHRVIGLGDLERRSSATWRARALGISLRPDIEEFCLNLNRYRLLSSSVRHHIAPQTRFLGHDPTVFDAIFPIENISVLAESLSQKTGQTITIPFSTGIGPRFDRSAIAPASLRALHRDSVSDYRFLQGHYAAPLI